MAVIAEAMRPQATAAQQAQTKTAISDTDKAEGTTSSNTTDSSDSAVDVKRDNNAVPVSATSATDSTIPPISFLIEQRAGHLLDGLTRRSLHFLAQQFLVDRYVVRKFGTYPFRL